MEKIEIPYEWDLSANRRYKRQNMEMAMKGKIERGLVELITNSDDSYRDLEEKVKHICNILVKMNILGEPGDNKDKETQEYIYRVLRNPL